MYEDRVVIEKAINTLAKIGETYLKPECRSETSKFEKVGMPLGTNYSAREIAELAYAAWEEMNAHGLCAVLNWCLVMSPIGESDKERVAKAIGGDRQVYYYDEEAQDWRFKTVRTTVTFEDIKEEVIK